MLLFLLALIVAVLGVGVYAHYNPGTQDINLRTFHFTGVPDWAPVAVGAGAMLFFFFIHAIYASVRIRLLRDRTSPVGSSRTAPYNR